MKDEIFYSKEMPLRLRSVEIGDIKKIENWILNPEVCKYTEDSDTTETEECLPKIREYASDIINKKKTDKLFIIEVLDNEIWVAIGYCNLADVDSQIAGLGIVIGNSDYWGKNYGPESMRLLFEYTFEGLDLSEIVSRVAEYNERAIKFHINLGFKEVGRKKQSIIKNKKFWDMILLSISKEEWKKLYKG